MPRSNPLMWLKPGCLCWLTRDHLDVEEAPAAAMRIVKDGTLAAEIVKRIRLLFKKSTLQPEQVDVNEAIREMPVLLRSEATRYNITVRVELPEDLPRIMGDGVKLQQVLMNLMVNSIDAMKEVDGTLELTINSQRTTKDQVLVSVSHTGVGLFPQQADQVFNAFLPPNLTARAWGFASPSLNRMVGARGLSTTPRAAQVFIWLYLRKSRRRNDPYRRCHVRAIRRLLFTPETSIML